MNVLAPGRTRLVLVGATGMVGGYALRYALDHPAVALVTAIGRRALGISHPKLKVVLHQDFADCSALADALSRQDAAIFCLGTYTGAVPDAELRKRVRPIFPCRQPWRGVFLFERQWCGSHGTKPAGFRTLQGRGRKGVV